MNLQGLMSNQPSAPRPGSSLMERYDSLCGTRSPYLDRCREYSDLTLNWLLPDSVATTGETNQHGWQSLGAQLVRHLANKITQTLFPTEQPFFAFSFTEDTREELEREGYKVDQLNQALFKLRDRAMEDHVSIVPRIELIKTFINLIITGNGLLFQPKKGAKFTMVPMDRYVIRRDMAGTVVEVVMVQVKHLYTFNQEEQAAIKKSRWFNQMKGSLQIPLYTSMTLNAKGLYDIKQEALEAPVGKKYTVSEEDSPFLPLVWMLNYGEHWGRGLVEEHAGDLYVYSFLMEAMAKGMALMADVKYFVKPGSAIDVDHAVSSPTGEWLMGNVDDVGVLQLERYADFTPISAVAEEYKRRLGQAFLLASAVRRDAERVTTYELRMDANELENSLGGMYSHMSDSLQKPLAARHMERALEGVKDAKSPLKSGIKPIILTGTEALGKATELDKMVQMSEMLGITNNWPEELRKRTKFGEFATTLSELLYLKTPWFMTEEEYRQVIEAERRAAMLQQATGEASKAIPDMMKQNAEE